MENFIYSFIRKLIVPSYQMSCKEVTKCVNLEYKQENIRCKERGAVRKNN